MSKRGTGEDHVSREQYDHEAGADGEEAGLFGQFRQASSSEMAKRVIKQPRSRLAKLNSASSDDGTNRPNPFAVLGANTFGTSTASSATPVPAPASTNPFAKLAFPTTTSAASPLSTMTTPAVTSTTAPSAPKFSFAPTSFSPAPAAAATSSPVPPSSSITVDSRSSSRADYERALEALNTTFVRKITKEVERNPIANLAQVFGQYVEQRTKVKARYGENSGEPTTKMAKKDSSDKFTFGSSSNSSSNGSLTASTTPAPSTSSFSFSIPAAKEGDAAPKPAFSGFSFGAKADANPITSTTTTTSSSTISTTAAPLFSSPFAGFGAKTGAATGSASTFSFGAPTSSISSSVAATTTTATTAPSSTPFSFNPSKPFSFNLPSSTPSTTATTDAPAAKPFSFQIPAQFKPAGAAAADAPATTDGEDDKMPDDTKSNMVDTREGEEGETTVYEVRAKLYAFEGNEHKDLGVGQFRVNEVDTTKKRRMIMRNATGMLTLNSWIIQGMPAKRDKATVTVFAVVDGKPKRYALRVKTEDSAKELEAALAAGQLGDKKADDEEKKEGAESK